MFPGRLEDVTKGFEGHQPDVVHGGDLGGKAGRSWESSQVIGVSLQHSRTQGRAPKMLTGRDRGRSLVPPALEEGSQHLQGWKYPHLSR